MQCTLYYYTRVLHREGLIMDGAHHGGISSHTTFSIYLYLKSLTENLIVFNSGCHISNVCIIHITYVNVIDLMAHSYAHII